MGNKIPIRLSVILFLAILFVFANVLKCQFTNWDDDKFIINNHDITQINAPFLMKMFTTHYEGGYQPLTQLSFAFDYKLGGLNPYNYHFTNLIIHALNTVCVFWVLMQWGLGPHLACVAALAWGVHPMRVESVAWVSERKDVLFTLFYLLAFLAYMHQKRLASWLAFVAACLVKHQAAIFGLILPIYDFFKDPKSVRRWRAINVYILFLLTGVALLLVTVVKAHQHWTNMHMFNAIDKIVLGCCAYIIYAVKSFIPYVMVVIYSYPAKVNGYFPWLMYAAPFVVIVLAGFVVYHYRRWPILFLGFAFFTVNIFLPLGNVAAGGYFVNDRYTYLASVGLFFIAAWVLMALYRRLSGWFLRGALIGMVGFYIMGMAFMTIRQIDVWKDGVSLWTEALKVYPRAAIIYDNRGTAYQLMGRDDLALADFNAAIHFGENFAGAYNNRAFIYSQRGQDDLALLDWNKAIMLDANYGQAYFNRGLHFYHHGQMKRSWDDLEAAIRLGISVPQDFLGYVYFRMKQEVSVKP